MRQRADRDRNGESKHSKGKHGLPPLRAARSSPSIAAGSSRAQEGGAHGASNAPLRSQGSLGGSRLRRARPDVVAGCLTMSGVRLRGVLVAAGGD